MEQKTIIQEDYSFLQEARSIQELSWIVVLLLLFSVLMNTVANWSRTGFFWSVALFLVALAYCLLWLLVVRQLAKRRVWAYKILRRLIAMGRIGVAGALLSLFFVLMPQESIEYKVYYYGCIVICAVLLEFLNSHLNSIPVRDAYLTERAF